jgi:hypothetical protein
MNNNNFNKDDNIFYLAKPIYGGWVSFTAHLSKKYDIPIYKISKRGEINKRDYGYDCQYQNININDIKDYKNIIITAIDKHYWEYLNLFPSCTRIIIHDPTECKISKKELNPLIQKVDNNDVLLNKFKVITIRESVQEYLKEKFNIKSEFLYHPFYKYEKDDYPGLGYKCVSIARIDFDKNTDIILKANKLIKNKDYHTYLFGAENRIYVHHKLKELNIDEYWKGKFPKKLSPTYNDCSILKDCKYMIDLSTIKNDGGGTQYTFLEAIYHDTILILNNDWIEKGNLFKSGYNCIGVSNEIELSDFLNNDLSDKKYKEILNNSKKILVNHI